MSKLNTIDISIWDKVGEGGNGSVYTCPQEPGILLKVSNHTLTEGSLDAISKEFYTSKAVFDLGIPTPEMYEIVQVGEDYGIKCQQVDGKKSLSKMSGEEPGSIDAYAARMAQLAKELHGTQATGSEWIPSMKTLMLEVLDKTNMISGKALQRVRTLVEGLEDAPTLLHGDFTFSNLIFAQDKPYWIDLGRATHGLPMFDLGHFYLFCNIFGKRPRVQDIAHMTGEQMVQFWNSFALAYNGPEDLDAFQAQCKCFAGLDVLLLGHVQHLTFSERFFLGQLAKMLIK